MMKWVVFSFVFFFLWEGKERTGEESRHKRLMKVLEENEKNANRDEYPSCCVFLCFLLVDNVFLLVLLNPFLLLYPTFFFETGIPVLYV